MYFLLESIILYIIFNIFILGFGNLCFNAISKIESIPKIESVLKKFLISYSIGTSLYIILTYLMESIWKFNLITGFYIYVVIDVIFYLSKMYFFFKNNKDLALATILKGYWGNFISYIKRNRQNIAILSFSFIMLLGFFYFRFWSHFSENVSHYGVDAYRFEGTIFKCIKYGEANSYTIEYYPYGFVLYISGILSVGSVSSITQIHFFCKIFPILILFTTFLLLVLNIMLLFPKRKIFAVIASFSIFYYRYFVYRSLMLLSTILISALLINMIFFSIYLKKFHTFTWILASAIFLLHPYNFVFIMISFALFLVVYSIMGIVNKEENNPQKLKTRVGHNVVSFFKDNYKGLLVLIGSILIYNIWFIRNELSWIEMLNDRYFGLDIVNQLFEIIKKMADLFSVLDYYGPNIPKITELPYMSRMENMMWQTSGFLFIPFLLFLILPIGSKKNNTLRQVIIFSKILSIVCLIFFNLKIIYQYAGFSSEYFDSFLSQDFFNTYIWRIKEIISIPMNLIILIGIFQIVEKIDWLNRKISRFIEKKISNGKRKKEAVVLKTNSFLTYLKKKKPTERIFSCIFLFFIMTTTFNFCFEVQIIREFMIDNDHTVFSYKLRELEENHYKTYGQYGKLFFSDEVYQDRALVIRLFSFDHDYKSFNEGLSETKFMNLINETMASGDVLILSQSTQKYDLIKYHTNFSSFADDIFENNRVLVLRIH